MTALDFIIAGTPRSGTTLVQRMTSELDGVRLPPETHFLSRAAYGHLGDVRFPLDRTGLSQMLAGFTAFHRADGVEVDAERVVARLDGRATSLFEVFAAVVAEMAGAGAVLGEKTPEHLVWWRPLTQAFPRLKVIAVVRDPRAVVASNLEVPFGMRWPDVIAQRWACDQDEVVAAEQALGPERCLILRYEDIVADPGSAHDRLARFLGQPVGGGGEGAAHVPREIWKERVDGPITDDRSEAWRDVLTPAQVRVITARTRRHLLRFGYDDAVPGGTRAFTTFSPITFVRRLRYLSGRRARARRIDRFAVTVHRSPGHTPG